MGGSPHGAGETRVLNWLFAWLCWIYRTPAGVYGGGHSLGRRDPHFYGCAVVDFVKRGHFLDCNKPAQPITHYNESARPSADLQYKPVDGKYPDHSLLGISETNFPVNSCLLLIGVTGVLANPAVSRQEAGCPSIGGHTPLTHVKRSMWV